MTIKCIETLHKLSQLLIIKPNKDELKLIVAKTISFLVVNQKLKMKHDSMCYKRPFFNQIRLIMTIISFICFVFPQTLIYFHLLFYTNAWGH